jgi:thiol-disulfide isomerase/thioredoxin
MVRASDERLEIGHDGAMLARALLLGLAIALSACKPEPARVELVDAPAAGDVATEVRTELARAHQDGRDLLVYVGATWCEPCRRFHAAAKAGALDRAFPRLRLFVFDLDRDGARLKAAGYQSRLIPLFMAPAPDGRASGRHIEGSIKGDGAVAEIAPRLRALLQTSR